MCLSPAALATGGFSVSYITDTDPDTLSYESDGTTNLLDYVNMVVRLTMAPTIF